MVMNMSTSIHQCVCSFTHVFGLQLGSFIYPTPHHPRLSKSKIFQVNQHLWCWTNSNIFWSRFGSSTPLIQTWDSFFLEGTFEWGWIIPLLLIYLPNRLSPGLHRRPKESKTCKDSSIGISKGPFVCFRNEKNPRMIGDPCTVGDFFDGKQRLILWQDGWFAVFFQDQDDSVG